MDWKGDSGRAEKAALLATLLAYGILVPLTWVRLRPGFLNYDEEATYSLLQAWREGAPWLWRFGGGCLHRGLMALPMLLWGPAEAWLRLPALAGVLLESLLLVQLLRGPLGGRAALWAALANLLCGATFVRARAVISPSIFPAVFLAHLWWLERLRRPWQHALFGLSVALWSLDYEGWPVAALLLAAAHLWRTRSGPRSLRWSAWAGLLLGSLAVAWLSPAWRDYAVSRAQLSQTGQPWAQVWPNLRGLLGWQDRALVSGLPLRPFPPPWIWLPALLGLPLLLRSLPSALLVLLLGALPLGLRLTDAEPHRLSLAYLALCAAAGAGIAWSWRRVWLRTLLLALALLGTWQELRAWQAVPELRLRHNYNRSRGLAAAAEWLRTQRPAGGWRLIDGLGPQDDAPLRFLLDQAGVRRDGAVPVAVIPWDYAPGLRGLDGRLLSLDGGGLRPQLLFLPGPAAARRLEGIRGDLAPLRRRLDAAFPSQAGALAQAFLADPSARDPWTRTVAWELWLRSGLQLNRIDPAPFRASASESLVSGWYYDAAAERFAPVAPDLSARLKARAVKTDPRRLNLPFPDLAS